jgi:hypothetical protein
LYLRHWYSTQSDGFNKPAKYLHKFCTTDCYHKINQSILLSQKDETMKNSWKWALGIVLTLVVAAGLFGLGFLYSTRATMKFAPRSISVMQMERFPAGRGDRIDIPRGPMMMREFGHRPFMPGMMFFGFIGRLIPLALFALLLYGAYQLGKGRSTPAIAPVAASKASEASEASEAPPAPATHPCSACDSPVQDGWKHCPNCGEKQSD